MIVAFPHVDGGRGKNRPALVVQGDVNNRRLINTIVAMITGNVRLATIHQQDIVRTIGHLRDPAMAQVEACLKSTFELA